jgi:hypothetical protein
VAWTTAVAVNAVGLASRQTLDVVVDLVAAAAVLGGRRYPGAARYSDSASQSAGYCSAVGFGSGLEVHSIADSSPHLARPRADSLQLAVRPGAYRGAARNYLARRGC